MKVGTKLKSLFLLLFSRFTVQDWLAILYIICVLFVRAVLSREIGKGFGPVCSGISFSHDTSTGRSVLRTGYGVCMNLRYPIHSLILLQILNC